MSQNLTLMPLRHRSELVSTDVFIRDRLETEQDYELYAQIIEIDGSKPSIKTSDIPPQMRINVVRLESVRHDAYGKVLTFAYAEELSKLKMLDGNIFPRNVAIKAYIDALPKDTPIILYWH
jgi:hypothetical protein